MKYFFHYAFIFSWLQLGSSKLIILPESMGNRDRLVAKWAKFSGEINFLGSSERLIPKSGVFYADYEKVLTITLTAGRITVIGKAKGGGRPTLYSGPFDEKAECEFVVQTFDPNALFITLNGVQLDDNGKMLENPMETVKVVEISGDVRGLQKFDLDHSARDPILRKIKFGMGDCIVMPLTSFGNVFSTFYLMDPQNQIALQMFLYPRGEKFYIISFRSHNGISWDSATDISIERKERGHQYLVKIVNAIPALHILVDEKSFHNYTHHVKFPYKEYVSLISWLSAEKSTRTFRGISLDTLYRKPFTYSMKYLCCYAFMFPLLQLVSSKLIILPESMRSRDRLVAKWTRFSGEINFLGSSERLLPKSGVFYADYEKVLTITLRAGCINVIGKAKEDGRPTLYSGSFRQAAECEFVVQTFEPNALFITLNGVQLDDNGKMLENPMETVKVVEISGDVRGLQQFDFTSSDPSQNKIRDGGNHAVNFKVLKDLSIEAVVCRGVSLNRAYTEASSTAPLPRLSQQFLELTSLGFELIQH
uniref:Galectin n=2 Tax=Bursaphelenchus xylophilus TaxID=6326 RepID=A0A1I7RWP8_BURXY